MERSLTVLLPVHDAQSTLAGTVLEVLEVVSDLAERFELVIIDDGSSDATSEIGDELARYYPQVRLVRHGERLGRESAVRTGLRHSSGRAVLVFDETCPSAIDRRTREKLHGPSQPARPNFLARLKDFAIEE